MCGIYKITNLVNGKSYVGQSIDIEHRFDEHKRVAFKETNKSYDYPLYKSMRKYGLQSFSFDVIEICDEMDLDEKEIFYISYFNSHIHQNGYNLTLGGDGGRFGIHVYQYDFSGNFINEYNSLGDAERKTGINKASIERAINGKKQSAGNFLWTNNVDEDISNKIKMLSKVNYSNGTKEKWIIDAYDLFGNFIKTFNNATDAGKEFNINPYNITRCIKRGINVTCNVQFVKHGDKPTILDGKSCCKKPVYQYTTDNEFIAMYDSPSDAGRILGFDVSSICKCCNGHLKYYKNSIWKYNME